MSGRQAVQGVMSGRPRCCFLLLFDVRAHPSSVITRLVQKVPRAASLKARGRGYLTLAGSQEAVRCSFFLAKSLEGRMAKLLLALQELDPPHQSRLEPFGLLFGEPFRRRCADLALHAVP